MRPILPPLLLALALASPALHAATPYTIVDSGQAKCYNNQGEIAPPKAGQPFYGQDAQYATGTRYVGKSARGYDKLFGVNFADGRIKGYDLQMPGGREKTFFVQCVRGNPAYGRNDFHDHADGTVIDRATGLMWSKSDSGKAMNWEQALAWVAQNNSQKYLGHDDWRLPSVKELQSIVDYSKSPDTTHSAAIDPILNCTQITNEAGKPDYPCYWSATTHSGFMGGAAAMVVAFGRAGGWMSAHALAGGAPTRGGPPGGATSRPAGAPGPAFNPVQGRPRPAAPSASPLSADAGEYQFVDVHGAGAQRSDPKSGDPKMFPHGRGPQGDVIRIYNHVRLVRGGGVVKRTATSLPLPPPATSDAEPAPTALDLLVQAAWRKGGIQPAGLCSDEVFIRRVYLDVIGTLPTADEVRIFLNDRTPNKRATVIDRLLERDEFADYWAMKWCQLLRVKSEFPINLWPNAAQAYHRWIRASIKNNLPYDRFTRELLTASGSNIRKPQVNFYRAVQSKTPQALAHAVALTFMGSRADSWPPDRLTQLAAFFSRVGYKTTAEWKEEIVFFDLAKPAATTAAVFPDGTTAQLTAMQDPREVFTHWLVSPSNKWFTRNIANRTWSWLLGRGIIHEPDDIRPDNPPANLELLVLLERELIASKYDLKHLFRLILKSRTYQLSCVPPANPPQAEAQFASYPVRRLEAAVLIDAINRITGTREKYISRIPEPFTYIPEEIPAIALADASITSSFLDLFGRSPRNTGLEAESANPLPTATQQLHLLNSSHILHKLEQGPKLRSLLDASATPRDMIQTLYLTILSRNPTAHELQILAADKATTGDRHQTGRNLAWALINCAEFQFKH